MQSRTGEGVKEKENTFEEMMTTMQEDMKSEKILMEGKFEKIKMNYLKKFRWVGRCVGGG